jgi:RHS repeat-associated protein
MTDAAKAVVWSAVYSPFGAAYTITGSETLNARFPGQWFQLEAGLHYNWHRHYDPSLGRYTQPDPLGFVDGPGVFAYARSAPHRYVDPDGRYFPGEPPPAAAAETLFLLILMMLPDQKPIPLPPPPPSPPEPEAKCTCSPETLDFMDMWVHRVCGWDNAFSCSGLNANEHGHVIRRNIYMLQQCLSLRQYRADVCYGGDVDPKHDKRNKVTQNRLRNCYKKLLSP